ncbi:MAG: aminotransferase class III-fold pyridoxal phosphate-dependent enzyme [Bauldia sp.]
MPELQDAFRAYGPELAGVFCEPYVQSYGCVPPEAGFLETMRQLCDAHHVPLVFDEVKTAFRHHVGGYQAICGVIPDLTAFSKALGNGFAIGGLAGTEELMDSFKMGAAGGAVMDGTNNASPYAMAAGIATLGVLMDGGVERLWVLGERMRSGLRAAIHDVGIEASVAGIGASWIVYFRPSPPPELRPGSRLGSRAGRPGSQSR